MSEIEIKVLKRFINRKPIYHQEFREDGSWYIKHVKDIDTVSFIIASDRALDRGTFIELDKNLFNEQTIIIVVKKLAPHGGYEHRYHCVDKRDTIYKYIEMEIK